MQKRYNLRLNNLKKGFLAVAIVVSIALCLGVVACLFLHQGYNFSHYNSVAQPTETTGLLSTLGTIPINDTDIIANTIVVNDVDDYIPAAANWFALGFLTPMTRDEVTDDFGVTIDVVNEFPELNLIEEEKEHGFFSSVKGDIIRRDQFVFRSISGDQSLVICLQEKNLPRYRIINQTADAAESTIGNTQVMLYRWEEESGIVHYCDFSINQIDCSLYTTNLSLEQVVLIVEHLILQ